MLFFLYFFAFIGIKSRGTLVAAGKKRMKLFSGSRKVKMKEIDTDEQKNRRQFGSVVSRQMQSGRGEHRALTRAKNAWLDLVGCL